MGKRQQVIQRKVDEIRQNMFVIHQLVERDKKEAYHLHLWEKCGK